MNILFKLLTLAIEIIGFTKSCKAGGKEVVSSLKIFLIDSGRYAYTKKHSLIFFHQKHINCINIDLCYPIG